jgi:hypothetical protein
MRFFENINGHNLQLRKCFSLSSNRKKRRAYLSNFIVQAQVDVLLGLCQELQKPSFPSHRLCRSSFWRFFFPWMCIRMFFSSVTFHLLNHSKPLATDITCPCFLFMLLACQVVRQAHQIDSKAPHYLDLSSYYYT